MAYSMPVLLCSGLFFPRATASVGAVILGGRELYRVGYMSSEGPNSKIREAGAMPLNIAMILSILSVSFIALRYKFGPFVTNRKVVKYFTESKLDK